MTQMELADVVIVGGGPAGLAAALVLGRAGQHAHLIDGGLRRNAAATAVHGFVTRDGISPDEFRRVAREQLLPYPSVHVHDVPVESIVVSDDHVAVSADGSAWTARYVMLCTGMIDVLPDVPGMRDYWGTGVVQCPFCHGWEVRGRRLGYLPRTSDRLAWVPMLRGWSDSVTVFTSVDVAPTADQQQQMAECGITRVEGTVVALRGADGTLTHVELSDGTTVPCDTLFYHPVQQQTPVVAALGLTTDANGFIQTDEFGHTSHPRALAAGDLTTGMQSALGGAAAGARTAAVLAHQLILQERRMFVPSRSLTPTSHWLD